MMLGMGMIAIGYALLYWGWSHFPGQTRQSLWQLLGFGTLWKNLQMPDQSANPIQLPS